MAVVIENNTVSHLFTVSFVLEKPPYESILKFTFVFLCLYVKLYSILSQFMVSSSGKEKLCL